MQLDRATVHVWRTEASDHGRPLCTGGRSRIAKKMCTNVESSGHYLSGSSADTPERVRSGVAAVPASAIPAARVHGAVGILEEQSSVVAAVSPGHLAHCRGDAERGICRLVGRGNGQ